MEISDLFRPKWKHHLANKRIEAIQSWSASGQSKIRKKLPLLRRLALGDPSTAVRKAAVDAIPRDEQQLLLEVAHNVKDKHDQRAIEGAHKAVSRLTDSNVLAEIATSSPSLLVAGKALDEVTDNEVLHKLASDATIEGAIRAIAVYRLADPAAVADFALTDDHEAVRRSAARALKDPDLLAKVVRSAADAEVRSILVAKATDKELLAEVVRTDEAREVRKEAIHRLESDPSVIEDLVRTTPWADVKLEAVRFLSDQQLLLQLALGDGPQELRLAAAERVTGRTAHEQLRTSEDPQVRHLATALASIHKLGDMKWSEREEVFKHLPADKLAEIATTHEDEGVRLTAVYQVKDKAVLKRLATTDSSPRVAATAAREVLEVGMSLAEVEEVLGPPSSGRSGAHLEAVLGASVGMAGRDYVVWRRPEGEWQLVFVGGKLDTIHSTPR